MAWFYNGRKYWYHNGKRYSRKIRRKFNNNYVCEPKLFNNKFKSKYKFITNKTDEEEFIKLKKIYGYNYSKNVFNK